MEEEAASETGQVETQFTISTSDKIVTQKAPVGSFMAGIQAPQGAGSSLARSTAVPPLPPKLGLQGRASSALGSAHLAAHTGLLQQVLLDLGALDGTPLVEVDVDVLPEAARVVIADGLGVPKRFGVGRGS